MEKFAQFLFNIEKKKTVEFCYVVEDYRDLNLRTLKRACS